MSEWTKQKLEQLIADGVEENLALEYKRAAALAKTDEKRAEITKDISALANSSGGVLIYGIAESNDKRRGHLPVAFDPVCRTDFSREWLEQVIQTIQPHIDGLVIHPVTIDEPTSVCYAVEVPQSHTAHQARDHVYYKRYNFNVLPMEDYEVRDVMNRKTHPKIRASIFVNKRSGKYKPEGVILVKLENVGRALARDFMVELELPIDMDGVVWPEEPTIMVKNHEGDVSKLRLVPGPRQAPIFPGSYVTLVRKIETTGSITHADGSPIVSARHLKISVYADEMPPLRATLDFAPVILGWTPVENQPLH
jgi:hypothetical protein